MPQTPDPDLDHLLYLLAELVQLAQRMTTALEALSHLPPDPDRASAPGLPCG
jgi:hypothetical protein